MQAVQIKNLTLSFAGKPLFIDFDFSIKKGCWTALLGRSGVGKSTLLRAIAGLEQDTIKQGTISVLSSSSEQQRVAFMAQNDGLLPWLSVLDNVQLQQHLQGTKDAKSRSKAQELLRSVQMLAHQDKACYQLSGGQRQRVALARTLMQAADIVLIDEPFSALDAVTRLQLQQLAQHLLADKTVVLVTHDPQEALQLCDQIFILQTQIDRVVATPVMTPSTHSPTDQRFWQYHQQLLQQLQQGEG